MPRTTKPMSALIKTLAACFLATGAAHAQHGASACGGLANGYGPFDYRIERNGRLPIVDGAHFTPQVEFLIKGDRGYLGQDLDYTLRASPNHHRALASVANWGVRTKGAQPPTLPRPVECYFDRAFRFQPDDTVPRLLFRELPQPLTALCGGKDQLASLVQPRRPGEHHSLQRRHALGRRRCARGGPAARPLGPGQGLDAPGTSRPLEGPGALARSRGRARGGACRIRALSGMRRACHAGEDRAGTAGPSPKAAWVGAAADSVAMGWSEGADRQVTWARMAWPHPNPAPTRSSR